MSLPSLLINLMHPCGMKVIIHFFSKLLNDSVSQQKLFSTVSWGANQPIIMISEGSSDTEEQLET